MLRLRLFEAGGRLMAQPVPSRDIAANSKPPLAVVRRPWPADAELAQAWRRLRAAQPEATVFSSHGFTRALWRSFAGSSQIEIHAVEAAGEVLGLLPLTRRQVRQSGVAFTEIGFFRNHHTLRNTLLMTPVRREEILSALLGALAGNGDWQVLFLENLPHDAPVVAELAAAASRQALGCDPWEAGRRLCYLPVTGSWDDYRASLSGNMRWQLKKFRRRAGEIGAVEFLRLATRREIAEALPEVFELQAKSWQGLERGDAAATAADHAFEFALLEELDDDEIGDLWLMKIGGRLVASLRMLGDPGKRYVHTMHFDPAVKDVTPGTLLFEQMLEAAWADRLSEVDFHGDSTFFRRWTSLHREHVTTRVYAASVFGRVLRIGRRIRYQWRESVARNAD